MQALESLFGRKLEVFASLMVASAASAALFSPTLMMQMRWLDVEGLSDLLTDVSVTIWIVRVEQAKI